MRIYKKKYYLKDASSLCDAGAHIYIPNHTVTSRSFRYRKLVILGFRPYHEGSAGNPSFPDLVDRYMRQLLRDTKAFSLT